MSRSLMVSWQADAPDGQGSTGLGPVGVGMMNNAGHQRKKLRIFAENISKRPVYAVATAG
jgi:hypothetical protein